MKALREKKGVLLAAADGCLPPSLYEVQFFQGPHIHDRSPVRRLDKTDGVPNIIPYGSCTGRATYRSKVVTTSISPTVEKICGVSNKWGPPQFNKKDHWLESLQHSSRPSFGVEGSVLSAAYDDYLFGLVRTLRKFPSLLADTRPLTRVETVCGIDGKKFVDKIPPSTSIGYPLSGEKRKHMHALDPLDHPDHQCPMDIDPKFWEHFDKCKDNYYAGERNHFIFKAFFKDEPTLSDKEKVRVVQAAPIVYQLFIRMYFLPIARLLSLFPAISECAVGLNCMGPEWHEMAEHMMKHGSGRILAGDYNKYDLRMPAQLMFTAFRIMIEIAKLCNYSKADIIIMEGVATDICYSTIAYNGDLLQHIGSNPSGHNLTVYINSIVNSLLFRCAYFDLKGINTMLSFREVCAMLTYGDDVKGSVHPDHDDFNFLYVAEYFARHDMVFTPPDKKTVGITPYMNDRDADFLKRKNVWHDDLERWMGALDIDSIYKPLHSVLKPTVHNMDYLCATNLDGAKRELFNHGRQVFQDLSPKLDQIATLHGLTGMCQLHGTTYDALLCAWKDRYLSQPTEQSGDDLKSLPPRA